LLLCAACSPTKTQSGGRPTDSTSGLLKSQYGDRVDTVRGVKVRPAYMTVPADKLTARMDWNWNIGGPINGTPALFAAGSGSTYDSNGVWQNQSTTAADCSDVLYVPVNRTSSVGNNLYAFNNLYDGCTDTGSKPACSPSPAGHCPTLAWSVGLGSALDGTPLAVNLDGSRLYVTGNNGIFYIINTSSGATTATRDLSASPTNYTTPTFTASSAWVDYFSTTSPAPVYVAGSTGTGAAGFLAKLDGATGAVFLATTVPGGISSTPVFLNGTVFLGSTNGTFYTFTEGATSFTQATGQHLGAGGEQIISTPAIDVTALSGAGAVFIAVGEKIHSRDFSNNKLDEGSISAVPQTHNSLSSPALDVDNHQVFVGHEGTLFFANYVSASGNFGTTSSASVAGSSSDATDPNSSPIQIANGATSYVYMGDGGGFMNRWNVSTSALGTRTTFNTGTAGTVRGGVILDYANGNIYFGSSDGHIYSIRQVADFN
jgi:hypothetical protein